MSKALPQVWLTLLALDLVACRPRTDFIVPRSNRPTHVDGSVYRAYGDVEIQLHRTADGCCTIWYVEEGEHAVARAADGLPERVMLVEQAAADVFARLNAGGWRHPVPDSVLPPVTDVGDSDNLDIYLVNFVRGDGMWVEEYCTSDRRPVCTGFLAMHNVPSESYTSEQEGVEVLVSHELFHAVQAAYTPELPRWFSEGTATLFEETIYPDQSDFERLCGHFFEHPGRSLNDPEGGFDGFSYSTALFFQFLQTHSSESVLPDVLERMQRRPGAEDAIIRHAGGNEAFATLFAEFSMQTWRTGERAPTAGIDTLPSAADYPAMPLTDIVDERLPLRVSPWASVGVRIPPAPVARQLTLQTAGQGVSLARLTSAPLNPSSAPSAREPVSIGETIEVPAGAEMLAVVSNADSIATLEATLHLVPSEE